MSRKFYVPVEVNNQSVSEEAVAWYFPLLTSGQYLAKKVVKAYCPVLINGQSVSKLFYEAGGGDGVIFDNGVFYHVPVGMDVDNYLEGRNVAALQDYFFYPNPFWLNLYNYNEWELDDDILKSGVRSGFMIPIYRMYGVDSIKYTCKTKITSAYGYDVGYNRKLADTDPYFSQSYATRINQSVNDWTVFTHDLRDDTTYRNADRIVDYIWISGMNAGDTNDPYIWTKKIEVIDGRRYYKKATASGLPTSYVPQPVKYVDVGTTFYNFVYNGGTANQRIYKVYDNTAPVYKVVFKQTIVPAPYQTPSEIINVAYYSTQEFKLWRSAYPSNPAVASSVVYNGETIYRLVPTFADKYIDLSYPNNICMDNAVLFDGYISGSLVNWDVIHEAGYIVLYGTSTV